MESRGCSGWRQEKKYIKELKITVPESHSGLGILSILSYQTGKSNGTRITRQSISYPASQILKDPGGSIFSQYINNVLKQSSILIGIQKYLASHKVK